MHCTYFVPHRRTGRKPRKQSRQGSDAREEIDTHGEPETGLSLELGRGLGLGGDYGLHLEQSLGSTASSHGSSTVGDIGTPGFLEIVDEHTQPTSAEGLGNSPWSVSSVGCDAWQPFALPADMFAPYVQVFLHRLYPVFPIFDAKHFTQMILTVRLRRAGNDAEAAKACEAYSLLCTAAAAVLVTLNLTDQRALERALSVVPHDPASSDWSGQDVSFCPADYFVAEALQVRQSWDFVDEPSEQTLMTSFFLFAYFGNASRSRRAWYYLREAVGFALAVGLDDPNSYTRFESADAQRRCRIFWLLFVTERFVSVYGNGCA